MRHYFSHQIVPWSVALLLGLLLFAPGLRAAPDEGGVQSEAPSNPKGIQGLWVWQSRWVSDAEQRADMLRFCREHGFNRLLVQIHRVRDAEEPTLRYPDQLATLIAEAADMGIRVEALDGAANMAMADRQAQSLAELEALLAFNQSLPAGERLVGIHYDIEPYLLDAWDQSDEQRQQIMRDLLTFYEKVRDRLDAQEAQLTLAADIPFWYDGKTEPGDNCVLTFNGETKNLHQHIQDICDYIGIMSYRREAAGSNGVIALVQDELDYAASIGKTIVPALETKELKNVPQITFFGTSPDVFWTEHNRVRQALRDEPAFGGMLLHSLDGAKALFDGDR